MRDLTQHFTTRADDSHAAPVSEFPKAPIHLWKVLSLTREHIEPDILRAFNALFANKGVTANDTLLQDVALLFRTLSMGHLRLYPDAKKVLRTLRKQGKGVYLLSNAQRAFTSASFLPKKSQG